MGEGNKLLFGYMATSNIPMGMWKNMGGHRESIFLRNIFKTRNKHENVRFPSSLSRE